MARLINNNNNNNNNNSNCYYFVSVIEGKIKGGEIEATCIKPCRQQLINTRSRDGL